MSVSATILGQFQANDQRTVGLNTNANIPVNQTPTALFTNGTGALNANVLWQASRTLSGTTDVLDLVAGLSDSYGTAVDLTSVRAIYVQNTGTSNITIGAAGSNPWSGFLNATGTIVLPPGAWIVAATPDATGWAVGSTSCNLQVSGTSGQTYAAALLGTGS